MLKITVKITGKDIVELGESMNRPIDLKIATKAVDNHIIKFALALAKTKNSIMHDILDRARVQQTLQRYRDAARTAEAVGKEQKNDQA